MTRWQEHLGTVQSITIKVLVAFERQNSRVTRVVAGIPPCILRVSSDVADGRTQIDCSRFGVVSSATAAAAAI